MDMKLVEILDDIGEIKLNNLISKLPLSKQIKYNDLISTELYGVLYDNKLHTETKDKLLHFALQNISSHTSTKKKLRETLLNVLERKDISRYIRSNPGLMVEYFFVDILKRQNAPSKAHKRAKQFHHTKGTHEQDENKKVDMVSALVHNKKTLNIWVQITTTSQHQLTYLQAQRNRHSNRSSAKKAKVQDISTNLTKDPLSSHDTREKKYEPHLLSYLVINGGIDQVLNKEKNNFLATAFTAWERAGYPSWGPIPYVRKDMLPLLQTAAKYYERSLRMFKSFMEKRSQISDATYIKNLFEADEKGIKYIETYKPHSNELVYEFFIKSWKGGENHILFSISYFINQHTRDFFVATTH